MITNIDLDKDKILSLARKYLKDGRIKDPYLLRHYFIYFPERNNPKIYHSVIQTKPNVRPLNKTPPTDDNNNEESENKESISDLLKSFKPYYSVNIERNTIIFHILLFADKKSSIKQAIKEVSIKEMKDYYYIYIKGYKNNDNKHFYNLQYGNFFIETDISKNELTLKNKKDEISEDNNGYIILTIN